MRQSIPSAFFILLWLCCHLPVLSQWQYLGSPDKGNIMSLVAEGASLYVATKAGVFYSHDEAASWNEIQLPDSMSFPREVYIENKNLYVAGPHLRGGIAFYRSDDIGESWDHLHKIQTQSNSWDFLSREDTLIILFDDSISVSEDHGLTFHTTYTQVNAKPFFHEGRLMSLHQYALYISKDHGLTWDPYWSNTGPDLVTDVVSIDHDLWKSEITSDYDTMHITRSSDDGLTWDSIFSFSYALSGFSYSYIIGKQGKVFLVDRTNPSTLFYSPDNGTTWSTKKIPAGCHEPVYSNGLLCFIHYAGIYLSKDEGNLFTLSNSGLNAASVRRFAHSGERIWINTGSSMYEKGNAFDEWILQTDFIDLENNRNGNLVAHIDELPKRSMNGGASWTTIKPTDFGLDYYPSYYTLRGSGDMMYWISPIESYYSSDNGERWHELDINISSVDYNDRYISYNRHGEIFSSANGIDWVNITYDLDIFFYPGITAHYYNGYVFVSDRKNLYRLFPLSTNWEKMEGPVKDFDPVTYPAPSTLLSHGNKLIAGVYGHGVLLSVDNGETWLPANEGLTDRQIISSAIIGNDLYLGMEGGAWKRALSEFELIDVAPVPTTLSFSVSPHPARDFIQIHFDDKDVNGEILFSLFDANGKIIQRQNSKPTSDLKMDITNIPPGIYFLQGTHENQTGTIRFIRL